MRDAISASARFEDLLLRITRQNAYWKASVEEIDDPASVLSNGTEYASPERAKRGALDIALELFGTNVPEEELTWHTNEESISRP